MANTSIDNYDFNLVGTPQAPFVGYISAEDKTKTSAQAMVRGSQNMFLEVSGNIAIRDGKKHLYPPVPGSAGTVTSYVWNRRGEDVTLVSTEDEYLWFLYQGEWHLLGNYSPDWSWATWWDINNSFEVLIGANGNEYLAYWPGSLYTPTITPYIAPTFKIYSGTSNTDSASFDIQYAKGNSSNPVSIVEYNTTFNSAYQVTPVTNPVTYYTNTLAAAIFIENPSNNDNLICNVSNAQGSEQIYLVFTTDIASASASADTAYIAIGATAEETLANMVTLSENWGTNTPVSKGFTTSTVPDILEYTPPLGSPMSFTGVDSLAVGGDQSLSYDGFKVSVTSGNMSGSGLGEIDWSGGSITYLVAAGPTFGIYNEDAGNFLIDVTGDTSVTAGSLLWAPITIETNDDIDAVGGTGGTMTYPLFDKQTNDFVLNVNNQLCVGSYSNPIVRFSFNEDWMQFKQSGDVVFGDPDYVILDENPIGGVSRSGAAYIGTNDGSWFSCTPNTEVPYVASQARTVYTKVEKFVGPQATALLGKQFITYWGETIMYVDKQNQLRSLGIYRNLVDQKQPALSLPVRTELMEEDFTGGMLIAVGQRMYMTAPLSGKVYIHEIQDIVDPVGNISSRRIWQPPQTWGLSSIAVLGEYIVGFGTDAISIYQLYATGQWVDDAPGGEVAPYIARATFAYRNTPARTDKMSFDKLYVEGYEAIASEILGTTLYDYQGASGSDSYIISGPDVSPKIYSGESPVLIGEAVVGTKTLGGGSSEDGLPKFRTIINVPMKNVFEYQVSFSSEQEGSRWSLTSWGGNERIVTDHPVELQRAT